MTAPTLLTLEKKIIIMQKVEKCLTIRQAPTVLNFKEGN